MSEQGTQYRNLRREDYLVFMFECVPGIVWAGIIYGILIVPCGVLLVSVFEGSFFVTGFVEAVGILFQMAIAILFTMLLGALVALVVSPFMILFVYWVNVSIGSVFDQKTCAMIAGGLSGYAPMMIVYVPEFHFQREFFVGLAFGPVLAMLVGFYTVKWYVKRRVDSVGVRSPEKSFRLGIRHLMVATVWFALLFTATKLTGSATLAIYVVLWMVLQSLILIVEEAWRNAQAKQHT